MTTFETDPPAVSLPAFSPVPRPQTEADQMVAAAKREAEQIRVDAIEAASQTRLEARRQRDTMLADARRETPRPVEPPEPAAEKPAGFVDTWSPRLALAATIVLTASGEFALAQLAGWSAWLAWALPTAIDVYVVQAFRRHRDVPGAISLMVAANALYHLAERGLFGVTLNGHGEPRPEWWLIVIVASIAPWVMWRIHRITAPPRERQQRPEMAPVPRQEPTASTAPQAPPVVASEPAKSDRQDAAPVAANKAPTGAKKPAPGRRQQPAKKAPAGASKRRSMDEWVELASPVFHAEFARLRRNPTADEFATAIAKNGLGKVSPSTAKNVRTEILDRTELPSLEDQ